jgi:hypothetical protein
MPWRIAVPLCAAILGVCAAGSPQYLLAGLLLAAVCLAMFRSVDWLTYIILFVIYTNAAAVAVRFHGVPGAAANGVMLLLGVPLLHYVCVRRDGIVFGPSSIWIALYAVWQLVSALGAARPETALEEWQTFLQEGVILYLLVTNLVRTHAVLRGVTWSLLLAGCVMGGVPLVQHMTRDDDNQFAGFAQTEDEPGFDTGRVTTAGNVTQRRLAGSIGEKNRYAQVMLMLLPLALYRIRSERNQWLKLPAWACLFFAGAGAYLAFSRSTIVAIGLTVLFAAALRYVNRAKVAIALTLAVLFLLCTPEYRTRLASLTDITELFASGRHSHADGALKGRATEMGAAALVAVDHPVLGVGPGMFKYYAQEYGERVGYRSLADERQAHCLLLQVAAENGLPGLVCILAVFAVCGWNLIRSRNRCLRWRPELADTAAAYLLVLVVYFTTGLFLHFAFIRYFWLMLALADCAALIAHRGAGGAVDARAPLAVS